MRARKSWQWKDGPERLSATLPDLTTQTYQQTHESPGAAIVQANSGALVRRQARATVGRSTGS